jgi:GTP:adenosylcobinamide-phosphate guanylyltransferase
MTDHTELLDAVVLAGAPVGEADLLLEGQSVRKKSLVPMLGRPMVAYVEEALRASGRVGRIVAMGLDPDDKVEFTGPVERSPSQGTIVDNILGGLDFFKRTGRVSTYVLVASSDIPLITGPVVSRFVDVCLTKGGDIFYSVVEREVMEARFPGSGRTFVHLRDGYYAGGDMFVFRSALPPYKRQMLRDIIAQRKNALKMAAALGPGLLIRFALGRLTLADAERRVGKVLGLEGRVVASSDAELAMDVDKPAQFDLVLRYLQEAR